jgi:actin-related protein
MREAAPQVDVDGGGIADCVFKCIQEMDIDNRMTMYQHIVMSGGSSMYPGMPSRCGHAAPLRVSGTQ